MHNQSQKISLRFGGIIRRLTLFGLAPDMKRVQLNSQIRSSLVSLFEDSGVPLVTFEFKKRGSSVSICAGAVRDALSAFENGTEYAQPRDIDIGIGSIERHVFDGMMREFGAKPNRYGGYRITKAGKPDLDFWRLEDTVGLKKTRTDCTLQNVLRSFVLNCNAVSFDPFSEICFDGGAHDAIKNKWLDFTKDAIIHSESLFASKAVMLCLRMGFSASASVQSFVARHWTPLALRHELEKVFSDELQRRILHYYVNDRPNHEYRWLSKAHIPFVDILCSLQPGEKRNKILERTRAGRLNTEDEQQKVHRRT